MISRIVRSDQLSSLRQRLSNLPSPLCAPPPETTPRSKPEQLCPGTPRPPLQLSGPLEASHGSPSPKPCLVLSLLCFPTRGAPSVRESSPEAPALPDPSRPFSLPPLGRPCPCLESWLMCHAVLSPSLACSSSAQVRPKQHHKPGGLKRRTFILSQMRRLQVPDPGVVRVTLALQAPGENLFVASSGFRRCRPPWLLTASPASACVCVCCPLLSPSSPLASLL